MNIEEKYLGSLNIENPVFIFTLKNKNGMEAVLTNYGATLVSLLVPKKDKKIDVVLGYDNLESYIDNPKFLGSTIGPNCNRINNANFTLNNKVYHLEKNDNSHNLHSGSKGLHKVLWKYNKNEEENFVEFTHYNLDNQQGFPGNINIKVRYTLTENNEIKISYKGISDKDTILNITNHSYFNLSGHDNKSATNQYLWLNSKYFTPVQNNEAIPTGEIRSVKNTPMDFTTMKKISKEIDEEYEQLQFCGGYDHNFIINKDKEGIEPIAKLYDENSHITMEVYSDREGVQFYSGNFISGGPVGKNNIIYENRCAICLETQAFPDSINNKNFKSPILKANEKYESTTIYKFLF